MSRPPKKSETLEVRLPYATKLAFMARCRDDGRSASEAVRAFIDERLDAGPAARPTRRWARLAAGALLAAAAGAVALPSLARTEDHAELRRLDLDRNGAVSVAEFLRADADRNGEVAPAELRGR